MSDLKRIIVDIRGLEVGEEGLRDKEVGLSRMQRCSEVIL